MVKTPPKTYTPKIGWTHKYVMLKQNDSRTINLNAVGSKLWMLHLVEAMYTCTCISICITVSGLNIPHFLLRSFKVLTESISFWSRAKSAANAWRHMASLSICSCFVTLQKHEDICEYGLTPCPNECSAILRRRSIERHLSKDCVRRSLPCPHCGADISLQEKEVSCYCYCLLVVNGFTYNAAWAIMMW